MSLELIPTAAQYPMGVALQLLGFTLIFLFLVGH